MEIKRIKVGSLQTNCYLLISKGELAIIDPGDEPEKILEEIKRVDAKPKYIINTHYHYDHTQANKRIKEATGADILIHENEKEYIDFSVDRFLKEGDRLKVGDVALGVILTPGHTKGSICLLGEDFIFTGDTLFRVGYGRTDLEGGSQEEMNDSLSKLKEIIRQGMMVYPGHEDYYRE